jgi:hypothetical protein
MILATLSLATALAVASPPPQPGGAKQAEPMPNFYSQPSYCRPVVEQEIARQNVALRGLRQGAEYAVMRQIDGCGVPTPVGYHPATLPGAADPTSPPKREDAPSNRR